MAFQLRTVFLFCLWDLQYAAPTGPALSIRTVQFSMRWEDAGGRHAQAVAITLANLSLGSLGSLPNTSIQSKYLVELISESGFRCAHGVGNSTVLIKDSDGNVVGTSSGWPITLLRQSWTADESILSTHEPPTWWTRAKCGSLRVGGDTVLYRLDNQLTTASTGVFIAFPLMARRGDMRVIQLAPPADAKVTPMADNLLAAGRWLKYVGRCVYDTDCWYQASQDPEGSYRFLTTPGNILYRCVQQAHQRLGRHRVVLPIHKGDTIRLLGPTNGKLTGRQDLELSIDQSGVLTLNNWCSTERGTTVQVEFAWAFQVL